MANVNPTAAAISPIVRDRTSAAQRYALSALHPDARIWSAPHPDARSVAARAASHAGGRGLGSRRPLFSVAPLTVVATESSAAL